MTITLRDEIHQRKPFATPQEEAALNIVRTGAVLQDWFEQLVKPYGITGSQYNVLRILRGAEPAGLCRNELRDRMLTRMPDVTRLLDRMEKAGLVTRTRDADDRRLVSTRITRQGRRMLDDLDEVVIAHQMRRLGHLDTEQLRTLSDLLTLVRQPR